LNAALCVQGVSVAWGQAEPVLSDLSFSLAPGELMGVVGPSGCGKSTLCQALAGIIPRQLPGQVNGEIRLLGRNLTELTLPQITTDLGIVFQDPQTQLFLPRVMNELAFGPENLTVPREEIRARIGDIAQQTGCQDWLEANPNQLSGGQQQIVALAAVLALQPRVLLLDEVTAQLDPHSCKRIQDIISDLRRQGVAVLMVEHNLEQLTKADRIISLRGGRMEVAVTGQGSLSPAMLARVYGDD